MIYFVLVLILLVLLGVFIIYGGYRKKLLSNLSIKNIISTTYVMDNLKDIIIVVDANNNIVSINQEVVNISGYYEEELKGKSIDNLIKDINLCDSIYNNSLEYTLITKQSAEISIKVCTINMRDISPNAFGFVIVAQDMTLVKRLEKEILENRKVQEELSYLSYHDSLTGLHNRCSFEDKIRNLELENKKNTGIIVCDLDGLKLVNDTLGHEEGDKLIVSASNVISESLTEKMVAARVGGDEFAIIVEDTNMDEIKQICENMLEDIISFNNTNPKIPLSISIGYSVGCGRNVTMRDIFKEADNNMYREKLLQSQNTKDSIINSLIKAFKFKDFIFTGHADRVYRVMLKLAKAMNLPEYKIKELWVLAQFHDIGKVGISDSILFKPTVLDAEEFCELKRHCEVGYRIAKSSGELESVAEYILKHHEWWNGGGYPLGLKGEEIPIECRILAIADAYDVMTTDRPYRKALSHEEAVMEIKRCSGKQFDPEIVSFLDDIIVPKEISE